MNKKLTITIIIGLVIVAAAAFVGGRLLNGSIDPMGLMPFGGGDSVIFAVNMTPAPELPTRQTELTGLYVERKDNIITIQSMSMAGDGGGMAVSVSGGDGGGGGGDSGGGDSGGGGTVITSSSDMGNGPKTEVVVTGKTIIYRDSTVTPSEPPSSDGNVVIQQTVEPGTLDDLNSQTMVMIWGRKNGDRIIADIIMYSNPIVISK